MPHSSRSHTAITLWNRLGGRSLDPQLKGLLWNALAPLPESAMVDIRQRCHPCTPWPEISDYIAATYPGLYTAVFHLRGYRLLTIRPDFVMPVPQLRPHQAGELLAVEQAVRERHEKQVRKDRELRAARLQKIREKRAAKAVRDLVKAQAAPSSSDEDDSDSDGDDSDSDGDGSASPPPDELVVALLKAAGVGGGLKSGPASESPALADPDGGGEPEAGGGDEDAEFAMAFARSLIEQ